MFFSITGYGNFFYCTETEEDINLMLEYNIGNDRWYDGYGLSLSSKGFSSLHKKNMLLIIKDND